MPEQDQLDGRMPSPAELRYLVDRQQIYDAMMRYCRGADRCDAELMASVYHAGALDHHGAFRGPAVDFVAEFTRTIKDSADFVMHTVANMLIEVDGDRAASEAYFVAYLGGHEGGDAVVNVMGGRYLDAWERRSERWGVVDRVVVHDWSRSDAVGDRAFPRPICEYAHGTWFPDDPVYAMAPTEGRSPAGRPA